LSILDAVFVWHVGISEMSHFLVVRLVNRRLLQMLEVITIGTAVKASFSSKTVTSLYGAHHAGLAASELSWVHWVESVTPTSPDLNPLDYHIWAAMLDKYHKLSQNPRRLMSWKRLWWHSGKSCDKNISTRWQQTSPNAWLPRWLLVLMSLTIMITKTIVNENETFSLTVTITITITNDDNQW